MIGFRVSEKFKRFLQKIATKEHRTLSNFLIHAVLTYIKEHHNTDYSEEEDK